MQHSERQGQFGIIERNSRMETAMRARFASFVLILLASAALSARAEWPDHAIKWVVPFAPGGANDLMGRAAAEALSKRLGQPIIIENKPGAGAAIGADYVAKAKP